jgi:DNA-binding response OmpR family regulator
MARKRILIVDDSATSLLWQGMILTQGKYEVLTARGGREGVDTALVERPDLVLMDVAMPDMGGYEACRVLRTNHATAAVPVIMVATKGEGDAAERRESGCSDHITKPIDKRELLAKVRNLLGD